MPLLSQEQLHSTFSETLHWSFFPSWLKLVIWWCMWVYKAASKCSRFVACVALSKQGFVLHLWFCSFIWQGTLSRQRAYGLDFLFFSSAVDKMVSMYLLARINGNLVYFLQLMTTPFAGCNSMVFSFC